MTTTTNTEIILRTRSSVQRGHLSNAAKIQCLSIALASALSPSAKPHPLEDSSRENENLFPEKHLETAEALSMLQSTEVPIAGGYSHSCE